MSDYPNTAPIVVGVDGSRSALGAVRWASAEAVRRDTTLRLVHGCAVPTRGYSVVSAKQVRAGMEKQGREWLDEAARVAAEQDSRVRVHSELQAVEGVSALLRESGDAALVVVGSRGLGGFSGMLLGSNAAALAAHAKCPIVVVRGKGPADEPSSDGPVVVGFDGSAESDAALGFAFQVAALRGASVLAVHAWHGFTTDATLRVPGETVPWDELDEELRSELAEQLDGWKRKYPDLQVKSAVVRGRSAATLVGLGETAQLLVVGRRGRGGFPDLLLGSTSQSLIYHAPCPVAVVRFAPNGPDTDE